MRILYVLFATTAIASAPLAQASAQFNVNPYPDAPQIAASSETETGVENASAKIINGYAVPQPGSSYFDPPNNNTLPDVSDLSETSAHPNVSIEVPPLEGASSVSEAPTLSESPLPPETVNFSSPALPKPQSEPAPESLGEDYIVSAPPPPAMTPEEMNAPNLEVYASDFVEVDQDIVDAPMAAKEEPAPVLNSYSDEGLVENAPPAGAAPNQDILQEAEPEALVAAPEAQSEPETIVFEGPRVVMTPPPEEGVETATVQEQGQDTIAVRQEQVEFPTSETVVWKHDAAPHPRPGLVYIQNGAVIDPHTANAANTEANETLTVMAAPSSNMNTGGWAVQTGSSVRDTLQLWSHRAGADFLWDFSGDFTVKEGFSQAGSFEAAVQSLLDQYWGETIRPAAKLYVDPQSSQKILVITPG